MANPNSHKLLCVSIALATCKKGKIINRQLQNLWNTIYIMRQHLARKPAIIINPLLCRVENQRNSLTISRATENRNLSGATGNRSSREHRRATECNQKVTSRGRLYFWISFVKLRGDITSMVTHRTEDSGGNAATAFKLSTWRPLHCYHDSLRISHAIKSNGKRGETDRRTSSS